ncbi:hypothetical protein, partial [Streptomyces sp. T21Q-yed]|uniref:hypothetical protein n=1 Tax=Streptomyces sp. T21Q-yed TaxID=3018441 RepID=UPI0023E0106F
AGGHPPARPLPAVRGCRAAGARAIPVRARGLNSSSAAHTWLVPAVGRVTGPEPFREDEGDY